MGMRDNDLWVMVHCQAHSASSEEKISDAVSKASGVMDHYEALCEKFNISWKAVPVTGNPGEAIVKVSRDQGIDLIVVGSRGLNKVQRTFLGSVSEHVLHHAHIPVLIVPPART